MKRMSIAALVLSLPLIAKAADGPYLFDFVADHHTGKAYNALISRHKLPGWVKGGGTSTPADIITIKGERFYALSGCKPHNCPAEAISVLYSLDKGSIFGLFSEYDSTKDRQTLVWMNLDASNSDEMRNLLFSRLYGDLSK